MENQKIIANSRLKRCSGIKQGSFEDIEKTEGNADNPDKQKYFKCSNVDCLSEILEIK